jgi:predicted Zn-dependent protease
MSAPRLSRKSSLTLAAIVVGTAAVGLANILPAMADTTISVSRPTRQAADVGGVDACAQAGYAKDLATHVNQNADGSFTVTYYCFN